MRNREEDKAKMRKLEHLDLPCGHGKDFPSYAVALDYENQIRHEVLADINEEIAKELISMHMEGMITVPPAYALQSFLEFIVNWRSDDSACSMEGLEPMVAIGMYEYFRSGELCIEIKDAENKMG